MPSGQTHDRITLWSLPWVVALAIAITRDSALVLIICGGFLFGGLMLGPDLDIHSIHFKRWGWFRWIWIPYRGSMRHRSPLSHAPIIGTVLRVLYLGVWLGTIGLVAVAAANEIWQLGWTRAEIVAIVRRSIQQHYLSGLALALGLELGALSHYIADWGVSTCKRYRTQGWKAFVRSRPAHQRSSPKRRSKS
jgi:uncharacterized metal-binding protein